VQGGVTDANGAGDVVVRLRATGSNTVMSTRNGLASTGNGGSGAPHLTGTSGTILFYTSTASNSGVTSPTTDTDPTQDIYRRVVGDDTSVLVSVNSAGEKATGYGELPAASRSGNIVSWSSNAQNLSTFQEQGYSNVFVRNMTTGVTTVHSRANGTFGAIGNKYSRSSAVSAEEIESYLLNNKIVTAADARIRARVARGSLGRAIADEFEDYVDQRKSMLAVLQALALNDDRVQLLRSAEEFNDARHKDEYESRLDILEALIRDAWLLALNAPAEGVINEDLLPELRKISAHVDSQRPADWISQIEEMREQLVVNINRKAATDALLLTMAAAAPPLERRRFVPK